MFLMVGIGVYLSVACDSVYLLSELKVSVKGYFSVINLILAHDIIVYYSAPCESLYPGFSQG